MILIVLPARIGSTRLARKPLQMLGDKPLVWWSWKKATQCKLADKVVVATDNQEIYDMMTGYGAECVMTSESCQSGTDRIYEVSQLYPDAKILINYQADEPLMPLELLDGALALFLQHNDKTPCIATAGTNFINEADRELNSSVKVVVNPGQKAIYFSRANMANSYLHVGLYIYDRDTLSRFYHMSQSQLELAERLEQLRALEAEVPIYIHIADNITQEHFGIDTPDDLLKASKYVDKLKEELKI